MIRKRVVTVVAVIAVVVLLIQGRGLLKARQEQISTQSTPLAESVSVPVIKPVPGVMNQEIPFLAQVYGNKHITLSTKLAGYIEEVLVLESQFVKKGELLVRIDETELRSSIDALKTSLAVQRDDAALAQSIYTRNSKLYRIGGLAKEQLEVSRVGMEMKRSLVKNTLQKIVQLEHQLSYLAIRAPFDGVVDAILLHEGDLAAVGKPILSMSTSEQKLLFSFAPLKNSVETGQMVVQGEKRLGEIRAIYPTSTNGLVTAEIVLDAPVGLPIGSSISVSVVTQSRSGCILPDTTVVHKREGDFLMVYDGEGFSPLSVAVVMHDHNRIMVDICPKNWVASSSEVKLAALPAYQHVKILKPGEEPNHE
jgi:RND family efflux transporter MFP subunit